MAFTEEEKKEKSKYGKQWRTDNRDKVSSQIAKRKEQYTDIQSVYYKRMMRARAKIRARDKNIPFDITENDIIIPNTCPIFGMTLKAGKGKGAKGDSPSLDRIVPSLGYVKGNIQVISSKANRIKSDATMEELAMLLEYYKH